MKSTQLTGSFREIKRSHQNRGSIEFSWTNSSKIATILIDKKGMIQLQLFRFDQSTKRNIHKFGSVNTGISPILKSVHPLQMGCMYFDENSILGMHPATCPQLFLVVEGSGWVKVKGHERQAVEAGTAVYWDMGEEHESGSDHGMTAMIIEGDKLDPETYLASLKKNK